MDQRTARQRRLDQAISNDEPLEIIYFDGWIVHMDGVVAVVTDHSHILHPRSTALAIRALAARHPWGVCATLRRAGQPVNYSGRPDGRATFQI